MRFIFASLFARGRKSYKNKRPCMGPWIHYNTKQQCRLSKTRWQPILIVILRHGQTFGSKSTPRRRTSVRFKNGKLNRKASYRSDFNFGLAFSIVSVIFQNWHTEAGISLHSRCIMSRKHVFNCFPFFEVRCPLSFWIDSNDFLR